MGGGGGWQRRLAAGSGSGAAAATERRLSGRGGGCGDMWQGPAVLAPVPVQASCGGPIEHTGCCPCEAPLFDDFGGMVCGDGGAGTASYAGCGYVGGADRLSLSKVDAARNLCVYARFRAPGSPGVAGPYPLEPQQGVEAIGAGPAAACTDHSLFTVTTGRRRGP